MTYTDEELDKIISLTGKSKALKIKDLLDKEVDRLKVEAQQSPDEGEARKEIPKKRTVYKNKLMEALAARSKTTGKTTGQLNTLARIIDMNIFHNGNLLSAASLSTLDLTGKIEIKNPNESIFDNNAFKRELESSGNLGRNMQRIKRLLEESNKEVKDLEIKSNFPLDKFLGSVDTSKASKREDIYDYWNSIANIFLPLRKDAEELLKAVNSSSLSEEFKNKMESVFNMEDFNRLQYVAQFPLAKGEVLDARHRFFNLVGALISTEGLLDNKTVTGKGFDDEISDGDVTSQLAREMLQGLKDADLVSSEKPANVFEAHINPDLIDDGVDWQEDVSVLQSQADPLLMYENNKGGKLLAMTQTGLENLEYVLSNAIDEIEQAEEDSEGNRITRFKTSLDFKTDIDRWLDELADTQTLDTGIEFWLPISVMQNADFDDLYEQKYFDGVDGYEFVQSDDLDEIQKFFDGMYSLLTDDDITFAADTRSSRGKGRGTDMRETFRGTRSELAGSVSRQYDSAQSKEGKLNEELLNDEVKGALEKFMETALSYYFEPSYSGRLPIQIPKFMGSVGGKVMQTLSLELGLETVMSGSYAQMMKGSAKRIKESSLENIADFLEQMFLKSIKIDIPLISEGERAARALTGIFGKNTKENNNDYVAALIHHFMVETGDISREKEDFNGKTIADRADKFEFGYRSRKTYPIFAMPHWLDMNQGLITGKNAKAKRQYQRLKNIFEKVQGDLPVLIHKMLKAHDAVREQLGKPVIHGFFPTNSIGYDTMISKMYEDEQIDLSTYEVETIIKTVDSHENISREFGLSTEQVYLIKAHFR
jgi:hypothetical protein